MSRRGRFFDGLELETVGLGGSGIFLAVNFRNEEVVGTTPEAVVAVEGTVGDHFFFSFGMIDDVFDEVEVSFEMAVDAMDLDFSIHEIIITEIMERLLFEEMIIIKIMGRLIF